jgi:hypothetical protein
MIIKLLIVYYRWLWNLPPFDTTNATMGFLLFVSAVVDIVAIVGITGLIITRYTGK